MRAGTRLVLLVLTALAAGAGPLRAADFHVSPSGSDSDPGTRKKPFATLGRARDAVRSLSRNGRKEDVVVEVAGGRYELTESVVFGPEDSGGGAWSVYYRAAAGETPVFSGGRRVTGFRKTAKGEWGAKLAHSSFPTARIPELFVNGRRAVRARSPNEGYFRVVEAGPGGRTSFRFAPGDLESLAAPSEAQIVLMHDWCICRVPIASVDAAGGRVHLASPVGGDLKRRKITSYEPHPRYFVEGAREHLDAPGEWHFDERSRLLRYRPRDGEEPETAVVVIPVATCLLRVQGEPHRPVRNLVIDGLRFEHCRFAEPPAGWLGTQAGFHLAPDGDAWRVRGMPAAVEIAWAEGVILRGCRVASVGGAAISLARGCQGCIVEGSEVADAGGNGIMIGEPESSEGDLVERVLVSRCIVRRCGARYYGSVGVWVGIARNITVERCEISDLPYTGVSVGWRWDDEPTLCSGNLVQANHIHHVMGKLSDGAGIYTLGRQPGTVLRGNLVHTVPVNAGKAESNGLFIDEGSTGIRIEGNTVHDVARTPIRFHRAGANTAVRNVLVPAPRVKPFTYLRTRVKDITLEGNVVLSADDPEAGRRIARAAATAGPGAKILDRVGK